MVDLFETIGTRTMVRNFKEDPVADGDREKILNAGLRAPTVGGNEQWIFCVVDSQEMRERLRELLVDAQGQYYTKMMKKPWTKEKIEKWFAENDRNLYRAPFYVAVFADFTERMYTNPNIEDLWAHQSAAAAIENMLLAAHGLGIGGCWFGVPLLMEKEFYSLLGVKGDGLKLAAVLAFGYPKEK